MHHMQLNQTNISSKVFRPLNSLLQEKKKKKNNKNSQFLVQNKFYKSTHNKK
jgi:hypothetical protein